MVNSKINLFTLADFLMFNLVGPDFNETIAKMIDKNLTSLNFYQDVFEARLLRKADAYDRYQIISFNENESILTYLNRVRFIR